MFISTSNKNKKIEIQRILPMMEVRKGVDLKEVDGTMDEVILYKALAGQYGQVVEDTILLIDGKEDVKIRWNQEDKLKNIKHLTWIVSYGYKVKGKRIRTHKKTTKNGRNIKSGVLRNDTIKVYRGLVNGMAVEKTMDGFGFDPYFLPDGADITLAELEKEGKKDNYSARTLASLNLLHDKVEFERRIVNIPTWTGKYQNED